MRRMAASPCACPCGAAKGKRPDTLPPRGSAMSTAGDGDGGGGNLDDLLTWMTLRILTVANTWKPRRWRAATRRGRRTTTRGRKMGRRTKRRARRMGRKTRRRARRMRRQWQAAVRRGRRRRWRAQSAAPHPWKPRYRQYALLPSLLPPATGWQRQARRQRWQWDLSGWQRWPHGGGCRQRVACTHGHAAGHGDECTRGGSDASGGGGVGAEHDGSGSWAEAPHTLRSLLRQPSTAMVGRDSGRRG